MAETPAAPRASGREPDRKRASEWPVIVWLLPWLAAVAVFVAGELVGGAGALSPGDWLLHAEPDSLLYLALLAAAPGLWWFRPRSSRHTSSRDRGLEILGDHPGPGTGCSVAGGCLWRSVALSLGVALASLLTSAFVGNQYGNLPPAYHDEYSYLFQAETFLAGRASFPSHPAARLFDQMHVLNEGRFASRYFPGTGLWMAPYVAISHPYAGHWIAGALCAVLMFWIGRELAGERAGMIAGLLTAGAPGMALFSNLLLAHHPTLVGLGVFLLGFLKMLRTGCRGWAFVSGTGLAFAMVCRPMTAAGVALPGGLYMLWWMFGRTSGGSNGQAARRFGTGCCLALPLVGAGGGLFVYNQAITGSGWVTPYSLYTDLHTPSHVYGFDNVERGKLKQGPRVIRNYDDWAENLTWPLAVRNAGVRLVASARWTLGLIPLTFGLVAGLVLWKRLAPRSALILAGIASLHLVHLPYWFVGMEDHHYVFEAGPLWAVWIGVVSVSAWQVWWEERRVGLGLWWGGLLVTAVVLNFTVCSGGWSAPLWAAVGRVRFAREAHAHFQAAVRTHVTRQPALVLVDSDPADRHIDYVDNTPDLSGPVLIGRYLSELYPADEVQRLFPERTLYLYRIRNVFRDGRRTLEEEWRSLP